MTPFLPFFQDLPAAQGPDGGKDPWSGNSVVRRKRQEIDDESVNSIKVGKLQQALHVKAKEDPESRPPVV